MAEVFAQSGRAWATITDRGGQPVVFHCDLTWLTSRWQCTYNHGCPGVDLPHQGCCSTGTYWSGPDDRERVERVAEHLSPELWQHYEAGRASGTTQDASEGPGRTRVVDGACVFLNREGFPTGPGCALHFLARAQGRDPIETKPDVCWQIPTLVTRIPSARVTIVSITEHRRADWGPAGVFMRWWCSSDTANHTATRPVYISCANELRAIMGGPNYEELVRVCDARLRTPVPEFPHPADP
jgi:hypothetical protein